MRIWRNWQTRTVQVRMRETSWRFKSSYPHQARRKQYFLFAASFFISSLAVLPLLAARFFADQNQEKKSPTNVGGLFSNSLSDQCAKTAKNGYNVKQISRLLSLCLAQFFIMLSQHLNSISQFKLKFSAMARRV